MSKAALRLWLGATIALLLIGFAPLAHSLCVGSSHSVNHVHEMFDGGMQADAMHSMPESAPAKSVPIGEIALYLVPAFLLTLGIAFALAMRRQVHCSRRCALQSRQPISAAMSRLPRPPNLFALGISRT